MQQHWLLVAPPLAFMRPGLSSVPLQCSSSVRLQLLLTAAASWSLVIVHFPPFPPSILHSGIEIQTVSVEGWLLHLLPSGWMPGHLGMHDEENVENGKLKHYWET